MTDADYTDDIALHAITPAQAESLLNSLKQAAVGFGLDINANKTEFQSLKREGTIFSFGGKPHKLVEQFTYVSYNISSAESDNDLHQTMV